MMDDAEVIQILNSMEANSVGRGDKFIQENQDYYNRYMAELYGDEEEDRSKVVSTDVSDVVESDMTSLVRVFQGAGEIVTFKPTSERPDDLLEAQQKNIYIPYLIDCCEDSFKKILDYLKCVEIYKAGVLEYGVEEIKKSRKEKYNGLDEMEVAAYLQQFEQDADIDEVKITSRSINKTPEGERYDIEVSLISKKQTFFIRNVPIEDLILTKNVQTKNEADMVGKRWTKTRGELVAMGFDEKTVKKLPKSKHTEGEQLKDDRYSSQDGNSTANLSGGDRGEVHWTMEMVSGIDVYPMMDYDEDGIRERRHIIRSGTEILLNEDFDHIPFVITSAIQMPHSLIGRSRAEITESYQRIQTLLNRGVLNNLTMVNAGRNVISENINADDVLAVRERGIVRRRGSENRPVSDDIMPLITEYVGDKTLQVIQYFDSKRSQSTGSLMANQGLEADDLYKETATRFKGTEEASKAKVELLARMIAELGFVPLYEGMAWFARHYQDDVQEAYVLGQTLQVNPSQWRYEHRVKAEIGTGAGDDEKILENRSALLSMLLQLKERGSVLVDDKKIYNQIKKISKAMGEKDISTVVNDPEKPEQILLAENEQLKMMVQQLQQQVQSNPLAEAEMIKAQAKMEEVKVKSMEAQGKETNQFKQFIMELAQKDKQFMTELAKDLTEMQLKYNTNVPGDLIDG